jgi:type IV secretory pathway VirJ component
MPDSDGGGSTTDYVAVEVHPRKRQKAAKQPKHVSVPQQKQRTTPKPKAGEGHSPSSSAAGLSLPGLAPRYLDTTEKLDAHQQMSRQRRDAACVKARLQRMFRELDQYERREATKSQQRQQREHERLPVPVATKALRRHEELLRQYREATAYRPVMYAGPATKSPSPVFRLIHGEPPRMPSTMQQQPRAASSLM